MPHYIQQFEFLIGMQSTEVKLANNEQTCLNCKQTSGVPDTIHSCFSCGGVSDLKCDHLLTEFLSLTVISLYSSSVKIVFPQRRFI